MARSLLAHMYSHIRGSQEDIATYSLQYIVTKSSEMNRAFTKMLGSSLGEDLGDNIRYSCQATGKQMERPDISGVNADNEEIVLCEAKFYAALTENQPSTYLDRLIHEDGVGLVFICPAKRRKNLWGQLMQLCKNRVVEPVSDYCTIVDGIRMSVVTWGEIIEMLRLTASSVDVSSLSDIDQLDGFCKFIDDSAFMPFSKEDFGPENARREERHYQVLDAVVDHLLADRTLNASVKGARATPYRQGYVRYIRILEHSVSINYDRPNWGDPATEETPYWTVIYDKEFKQPKEYQQIFKKYPVSYMGSTNNVTALPLFAPTDVTLDEVAKNIKDQIIQYIDDIDKEGQKR